MYAALSEETDAGVRIMTEHTATLADAYRLIHEGALACARAEQQGIRIDVPYCDEMKKQLTARIEEEQAKLQQTELYSKWEGVFGAKTNIGSNYQLSHLLYKVMRLPPPKSTESGQGSTDEDALGQLKVPGLDSIIQIRKLQKIRDTYLESFVREQRDGWIHPSFLLHTVRTYRSSSADPNFQNIPKRDKEAMRICRRALLPRPGYQFIELDFAALEVRIAACYCKDPMLIKYLSEDGDMHLDMAKQIFMFDEMDKSQPAFATLRQAAKNAFVFPQFYGDYYGNNAAGLAGWAELPQTVWKPGMGILLPDGRHIADHLIEQGIPSYKRFVDHIQEVEEDFWNNRFSVYNAWRRHWVTEYRKKGYLTMYTGFVCSGVMRKNEILNYPIQGTAFHCLLYSLIHLDRYMRMEGWKSRIVGQIHDSIIIDAHPDEAEHITKTMHKIVKEEMPRDWQWIIVPMDVEEDIYGVDSPWVK